MQAYMHTYGGENELAGGMAWFYIGCKRTVE